MNIPPRPRFICQLVLHRPTGERYAFRVEVPGYRVTGCIGPSFVRPEGGPRNLLQWRATDLESLSYDADTELIEWANENQGEFDLTG